MAELGMLAKRVRNQDMSDRSGVLHAQLTIWIRPFSFLLIRKTLLNTIALNLLSLQVRWMVWGQYTGQTPCKRLACKVNWCPLDLDTCWPHPTSWIQPQNLAHSAMSLSQQSSSQIKTFASRGATMNTATKFPDLWGDPWARRHGFRGWI